MRFINKERQEIYEIEFLQVCRQLTPSFNNMLCSEHLCMSEADSQEKECLRAAWLDFKSQAVDKED